MGKIQSETDNDLPYQHGENEKSSLAHTLSTVKSENISLKNQLHALTAQLFDTLAGNQRSQELQLAELIIENSPAVLFRRLADDDTDKRKMVYVSPNISRFGYQAKDFLENAIMFRDIVHPDDIERVQREIRGYVSDNKEAYTQFYRITTKNGEVRWVEDRTSVVEDPETGVRYHQGIVIDIHKRKVAEEKLRKSEEKYRRIVETTAEGFLLLDKSLKILDLNTAYAEMVGIPGSELLGKQPGILDSSELQQLLGMDKKDIGSSEEFRKFECHVQSSGKYTIPVLIHANTLRSDSGEILGIMAFVTDMTEQKKALILAGEVQKSLLPEKPPSVPGLDIAGKNIQCDEVGGDYYDYLNGDDSEVSNVSIIIGDITGHGVDSALLMSSARAFLRMRASQPGSMADIITDMNRHLSEDVSASGRFMTLFCLCLDKHSRSLQWVRAGHDPALLYTPVRDAFEELKGPGIALGIDKDFQYHSQPWDRLETGQIIIMGTDGIWEAFNSSGQMFGKNRLKKIIRDNAAHDAQTIMNAVFAGHNDFTAGVKREDDVTLVIVKAT